MAKCRGCDADMRWGFNVDTGKGVPLDPDAVPDGNLVRVGAPSTPGGEIPVRFVKKGEELPVDAVRFVSHFATCPEADSFRSNR